jgi:hypothetical protein
MKSHEFLTRGSFSLKHALRKPVDDLVVVSDSESVIARGSYLNESREV